MVHPFPMIARAQDGDRLFVASTGLRYLARNWKFESISLQRGVCKPSAPLGTIPIAGGEENAAVQLPAAANAVRLQLHCAGLQPRQLHADAGDAQGDKVCTVD